MSTSEEVEKQDQLKRRYKRVECDGLVTWKEEMTRILENDQRIWKSLEKRQTVDKMDDKLYEDLREK